MQSYGLLRIEYNTDNLGNSAALVGKEYSKLGKMSKSSLLSSFL